MNKTVILLLSLLFILTVNCSGTKGVEPESYVEVYYIPFSMSTEGKLVESETRNLKVPYVSFFCTSDKKFIKRIKHLSLATNNTFEKQIDDVAPYMLIDIFEGDNLVKTITVGSSVFFKVDEVVYLMSKELKVWIDTNIPVATFPVGSRENGCNF